MSQDGSQDALLSSNNGIPTPPEASNNNNHNDTENVNPTSPPAPVENSNGTVPPTATASSVQQQLLESLLPHHHHVGSMNAAVTNELFSPFQFMHSNDLQRRRTEALERILLASSDSNLTLPLQSPSQQPPTGSGVNRGGYHRRMREHNHQRLLLNRNNAIRRSDLERAIFIPFGTRGAVPAQVGPSSAAEPGSGSSASTTPQRPNGARDLRTLFANAINVGAEANNNGSGNGNGAPSTTSTGTNAPGGGGGHISTFFMHLTYSASDHSHHNIFQQFRGGMGSAESQRRRLDVHAANTMVFIKRYCPVKPHKFSQFRYCTRALRQDYFDFKSFQNGKKNPLAILDPTQVKCHTKVMVLIRDSNMSGVTGGGKLANPFTSYLMSYLSKKHMNPTCLTFPSTDAPLNVLIEQLYTEQHVFSKKSSLHDALFRKQAKGFLLLSTLAKLVENWNIPLLILDSSLWKSMDVEQVLDFGRRFQVKVFDVDSSDGIKNVGGSSAASSTSVSNKQRKAAAKRLGRQVKKAVRECNIARVRKEMGAREWPAVVQPVTPSTVVCSRSVSAIVSPNLISDDCRRIFYNLHERLNQSWLEKEEKAVVANNVVPEDEPTPQLSLLEDGILADIENSDVFKYDLKPERLTADHQSRPISSYSLGSAGSDEQEKVTAELLFSELNQRWRVHGPQRYIPKGGGIDTGPYCSPLAESEKQLLLSVLQEVANFEKLKDSRNVLKDSKKELEGRLYGYNPDFTNLIASAEEFLHGKSSCMEPTQDEMDFYRMPVSFVLSEAEVKYMKAKPPVYVMGSESPSQFIKMAMDESTKLFWNSIMNTTCFSRPIPSSKRHKTKAIIVIEDNNEVLELLTAALWFFEKTPVATFQSKYCCNNADFLLGIDAIRFYYGNYPVYSAKKEDEHIFERWLGVGLNGILRSFQSKIVLIDFPRPGSPLQKSRNILFNRLKLEEKLHDIKSFTVGKPTRKEDNLSTVENVLDQIQKCLAPRDILIFRKARRMYLDLKLYKQLEQKSRQDLKSLRDWGLPEPINEHELWEGFRNSELIINPAAPAPPEMEMVPHDRLFGVSEEGMMMPNNESDDKDDSAVPSIASDEDFSDSTTINANNSADDGACLSQSEEDEHDEDEITPPSPPPVEEAIAENKLSEKQEKEEPVVDVDVEQSVEGKIESEKCPKVDLEETHKTEEEEKNDLSSIQPPVEFLESPGESGSELLNGDILSMADDDDIEDKASSVPDVEEKAPPMDSASIPSDSENGEDTPVVALKRSNGYFNLLDETALDEEVHPEESRTGLGGLEGNEIDDSGGSSTTAIKRVPEYTRLEFTLAPKMSSGESSTVSITSLFKLADGDDDEPNDEDDDDVGQDETNFDRNMSEELVSPPLPKKKRSLQETCVAHLGKLSKSFTQLLRRRKPRRIFPEGLLSPALRDRRLISQSDVSECSSSSGGGGDGNNPMEASTTAMTRSCHHHSKAGRNEPSSSEQLSNLSNRSSSNLSMKIVNISSNPSHDAITEGGGGAPLNNQKIQHNWLNNLVRFVRGKKVHKKKSDA